MKKILLSACALLCALSSCKKDDDPIKDNFSPIYIWGKSAPNKAQAMSAHEILTSVNDSIYICVNASTSNVGLMTMTCLKNDVDTINDRLIVPAGNIIYNGTLTYAMLNGRNYYVTIDGNYPGSIADTVGYIPNAVWRELTPKLDSLWYAGNVEEIYRLFNSAFYFYPSTPEEYKAQIEEIDWEAEGIKDAADRPRWLPKYEKK